MLIFVCTTFYNLFAQQSGTLDTSFDSDTIANGYTETLAIQNDGKIIVGGYFGQSIGGNLSLYNFVRLNPNGSKDNSFIPHPVCINR